jgi:hypothetical protein
MNAGNVRRLAREAVEAICALPRRPTDQSDPILDNASRLIARGMRNPGFASTLLAECERAGLRLAPQAITQLLISTAHVSAKGK